MIEKSVWLACGVDEAFALFCERAGEWWPVERRHTGDWRSEILIDPSGDFLERSHDGKQVQLGAVRVYDPPSRLVLNWYPGTGPDLPTEVEVRFVAENGGTRITVRHGPGGSGEDLYRRRVSAYEQSWELVLGALLARSE